MIILLDIDGVIADFNSSLIQQYNFLTGENVIADQIKTNKTSKHVKDPNLLKKIIESPGFIRNLQPIPGAIEAITKIHSKGHDIAFVSNGTNCPTSGFEKREWLRYYFNKLWKMVPLVLTKEKWRVRGDCLLDDDPKNFINLHKDTKALLFNQIYNADVNGVMRINDWNHMLYWMGIE